MHPSHGVMCPSQLTRFGVNASLSSHGVSLGEVAEAVKNVAEASEYMPTILTTLRAFHNLSKILLAPPKAERLVDSETAATIGNITCECCLLLRVVLDWALRRMVFEGVKNRYLKGLYVKELVLSI